MVHGGRALVDDRPELLAVDGLGDRGAAGVSDRTGDLLDRHAVSEAARRSCGGPRGAPSPWRPRAGSSGVRGGRVGRRHNAGEREGGPRGPDLWCRFLRGPIARPARAAGQGGARAGRRRGRRGSFLLPAGVQPTVILAIQRFRLPSQCRPPSPRLLGPGPGTLGRLTREGAAGRACRRGARQVAGQPCTEICRSRQRLPDGVVLFDRWGSHAQ